MSATKDNESYFDDIDNDQIGGASDSDSNSNDSDSDSDAGSSSSSDSDHEGGGIIDDELDGGAVSEVSDVESSDSDDDEQEGGGRDDDNDDAELEIVEEEEEQRVTKSGKKIKKIPAKKIVKKAFSDEIPDDDDEDEDGEIYLKKFDKEVNDNYILNNHPECAMQNYDEIIAMTKVVRDTDNIVIDDLHRTNPFLTKYERARILGQRAKQIETGATPFVKVPENIIDSYLIAEMELQQGRIPFIIRRPLPNGGSEYWKINDLENIAF